MSGFMSEYILGLGISVKICKLYDELVSLVLSDSEYNAEFKKKVLELESLLDDEILTYEKLDDNSANMYYDKISSSDLLDLDNVKSRYFSKIKERLNILDGINNSGYPFSLNTAIMGKILLDAIKKVENNIVDNLGENPTYDLLYSFHKTYKYSLISSNDFLERLAVDFNFNLAEIPNIGFDKIKKNFNCNDNFDNYLNNTLLIFAKDTVGMLTYDEDKPSVTSIYSNLLTISQLDVIITYLNKKNLYELLKYLKNNNIDMSNNTKYIKKLIQNKINGDTNGKYVK